MDGDGADDLAIREEHEPCLLCLLFPTNIAITKGEKRLVSKVIEKAVKSQSTEPEKILQSTQTLKDSKAVKTLEATDPVKSIKDRDAPHSYLSTSPLSLVTEREVTPVETRGASVDVGGQRFFSSSTHTF